MKIHLSANRTKSVNSNGSVTSAVLTCHTSGADPEKYSDDEVLNAVLKFVPENLGAAALSEAAIVEYHGAGVYEIEVSYEQQSWSRSVKRSLRRPKEERWFLSSSHSIEHVFIGEGSRSYGRNQLLPGTKIGWNGKTGAASYVAGTKKIVPVIRENCVLTLRLKEFNNKFRQKMFPLIGCVNSLDFHGWARGEVLFIGASTGTPYFNDDEDELIDVTMKFAIRRNATDVNYGGVTHYSARGWEVVWPVGEENICVAEIYQEKDFNILGVGRNGY